MSCYGESTFYTKRTDYFMYSLSFIEFCTLLESIRTSKTINWDTGEGIHWIRPSKEDLTYLEPFSQWLEEND